MFYFNHNRDDVAVFVRFFIPGSFEPTIIILIPPFPKKKKIDLLSLGRDESLK